MERREKVNALKELARRSGQTISFDPERHGEAMLDGLERGLTEFLEKIPEEIRDEYEDKYIEKYKEWLYAMSRCFSQAITGAGGWKPATFRRHEKTNAAEHAAYERLLEWKEKVIKRCNRQQRLTGWAEVERLQEKLDELTRLQEMMKEANRIIRSKKLAEVEKVDEIVALGISEVEAIALMDGKGWWGVGFAPFQLSNNSARIRDTERKLKQHQYMAEKEDGETTYEWGTLRRDYSEERYRLVFDGKPSKPVIDLLKGHGFKWSPKNEAWQRQITPNATYTLERLVLTKLEEISKNQ